MFQLKIENFGQIKGSTLNTDSVFHFLYGKNNAVEGAVSNGAGKSLVIDAVIFGLYGKSLRGLNVDDLVGPFGKKMKVTVSVEIHGNTVKVVRQRGPNKVEVHVNGEKETFQRATQAQERIDTLLGMDYKSFMISGYYGEFSTSILDLTPAQRTARLLSIMKYDEIAHAREDVRVQGKVSDAANKIIEITTEIKGLERLLSELDEDEWEGKDRLLRNLEDKKRKYKQAKVRYASLKKRIENFEIPTLQTKHGEYTVDSAPARIAELEEELSALNDQYATELDKVRDAESDLAKYREVLDAKGDEIWRKMDDAIREVDKKEVMLRHKLSELEQSLHYSSETMKSHKSSFDSVNQKLKELESSDTCPVCGNEIDEEHKAAEHDKLKAKLGELDAKVAEASLRMKQDAKELEDAEKEHDNLDADSAKDELRNIAISEAIEYLGVDAIEGAERKIRTHRALSDYSVIVRETRAIIHDKKSAVSDLTRKRLALRDEISELKRFIESSKSASTDLNEMREQLKELVSEGQMYHKMYVDANTQYEEASKEGAEKVRKRMRELEKKIKKHNKLLSVYRQIHDFGTNIRKQYSAYKKRKSHEFVAKLQSRMNFFFREMGSMITAQFEYDENENVHMLFTDPSKSHDKAVPYKAFSRGERTRIRKALFWLMVDITKPPFVLSDESNDGLDELGLAGVLKFSSERFSSMLYIEASPIEFEFDGVEKTPVILAQKDMVDGEAVISLTVG